MDTNKIPTTVLNDLHKRGLKDKDIALMSPEEAFEHFCEWNGILNFAPSLIKAIDGLRAAKT